MFATLKVAFATFTVAFATLKVAFATLKVAVATLKVAFGTLKVAFAIVLLRAETVRLSIHPFPSQASGVVDRGTAQPKGES